ncbi:uncharacterized protein UHOR_08783 [Ustilago hordei]|uniref:Uncharacterized protein n=1 Tax=Ustilago hordei TaxID=120017 RepID=I2FVR0_USTHO|nr:uncharacterized protein UHOR_08783 [Ustilago hordei]
MVAQQASLPNTSVAAVGGQHATTPSTSSFKPTGWIRSNSRSKPSAAVLADRTNLPPTSRHTPARSVSKTPVSKTPVSKTPVSKTPVSKTPVLAPASVQSVPSRTPSTGAKGASGKQQKLSSFFAPNTTANRHSRSKSILYQDSPSVGRAQRSHSSNASVQPNLARPSTLAVFEDQELEQRAASLLRGRFGTISRSLNPSRSSTPTRPPASPSRPPPADPLTMARSPPKQHWPPKTANKAAAPMTPPRLKRFEPQQPPSSPMFHQTLMQESLSNFTPPAWENAIGSNMALFQRLAGLPPDEIKECEKSKMEEELEKAHRRLQGRSPTAARRKDEGKKNKIGSPLKKRLPTTAERVQRAAALSSASPKTKVNLERLEPIMRSPRTNRRIYALETQLDRVPNGRATSLQPLGLLDTDQGLGQRRAVSEARCNGAETSRHNSILPATMQEDSVEEDSETQPLLWPEESETQPLAWPDEAEKSPPPAIAPPEANGVQTKEAQLLAWDDVQEPDPAAPVFAAPTAGVTTLAPHLRPAITEVPTSDDEDLLLQRIAISSSSSSPTASRSNNPTSSSLHPASPAHKRRRIDLNQSSSSPALSRTPLRLAKVSPITLTPTAARQMEGLGRFDRVVAALRKEERRQNTGLQLHLNSFLISTSTQQRDRVREEGKMDERRAGLSAGLSDELSDDEGVDTTITHIAKAEKHGEGDETQPLPWSTPCSPTERPALLALQMSCQPSPPTRGRYTGTSSSSSSSGGSGMISFPSESNLRDAGGSELVSFIDRL